MYSICYCRVIILSHVSTQAILIILHYSCCYRVALVLKLIVLETINVCFVVNTRKNYGPLQVTMHRIIYMLLNLK